MKYPNLKQIQNPIEISKVEEKRNPIMKYHPETNPKSY